MIVEKALKKSVLFKDLDQNVISSIALQAQVIRVVKGEFVYQQDDTSHDLYIIV